MPNSVKYNLRKFSSRIEEFQQSVQNELSHIRQEVSLAKNTQVSEESPLSPVPKSEDCFEGILRRIQLFESAFLKHIAEFRNGLQELVAIISELDKTADSIAQKTLSRSILIYGYKEQKDTDLYQNIRELFKSKLNVTLDKHEVTDCFRLGTQSADRPRPVALEFVNKWKLNEVFNRKSAFKGSSIVVAEMLTKRRYNLYTQCRKKLGNKCWTNNGRIMVKTDTGRIEIADEEDLAALSNSRENGL